MILGLFLWWGVTKNALDCGGFFAEVFKNPRKLAEIVTRPLFAVTNAFQSWTVSNPHKIKAIFLIFNLSRYPFTCGALLFSFPSPLIHFIENKSKSLSLIISFSISRTFSLSLPHSSRNLSFSLSRPSHSPPSLSRTSVPTLTLSLCHSLRCQTLCYCSRCKPLHHSHSLPPSLSSFHSITVSLIEVFLFYFS
jgi:hypothetical protein